MTGPLAGIRVVEASRESAGLFAGLLLSDLGAEVVRIDDGPTGVTLEAERSLNRGKRQIKRSSSSRNFDRLADGADIIIVDDANLGELVPRRSHHVRCDMPPFPKELPVAANGRDARLIDAYTGILSTMVTRRGGPGFIELPEGVYGAGAMAAAGSCAALYARYQTGVGQEIEVSWLAGGYAMQLFNMIAIESANAPFNWTDDPTGWNPTNRLFQGSDGRWFYLGCPNPMFFARLCMAINRTDIAIDERYANSPHIDDPSDERELKALLLAEFSTQPAGHWIELLESYDIICGPVLTREEWMKHPQNIANDMVVEVEDAVMGTIRMPGLSLRFRNDEWTPSVAPAPDQDDWEDLLSSWEPRQITPTGDDLHSPLEGVKVIDLATYAAAPIASRILGDMGAEIVKIEARNGDPFRGFGLAFSTVNRGNKCIALSLDQPGGRKVFDKLVEESDVLFTNLRPATLERLGIQPSSLHALNPGLVYIGSSGFGWSGPWADKPCIDLAVQAVTGWSAAQGGRESPVVPGPWPFDNFGPQFYALMALAGLVGRRRGADRQWARTSMAALATTFQHDRYLSTADRPENRAEMDAEAYGFDAGYRLYEAADGWVLVAASGTNQWMSLLKMVSAAGEFSRDDERATSAIGDWMRSRSRDLAIEDLCRADISCSAVRSREEALRDPRARLYGLTVSLPHPIWGNLLQTGNLVRFSKPSLNPGLPSPPEIGADTAEVLEGLGYSAADQERLRRDRIIN